MDVIDRLIMKRITRDLSESGPLSPMTEKDTRERKRYPRRPCSSLNNLHVVLLALVGLLIACPLRFGSLVSADQGGYNNAGGYDYGGYNNDNQYQQESFEWPDDLGFDEVSVLPVSCITYNGGHMIKFDLYNSENNYNCHFNQVGSFVVSIAHFMRAYFNNQAITNGKDFSLPGDAGYLNCVMLQETAYADNKLYAKIGCMDRQTFTSTKLQLHLYTDDQCSVKYDDGYSSKRHYNKGYEINGYTFSSKVSFRPPFYSCQDCVPSSISDSFNKKNTNWYDDDYISQNGQKQNDDDEEGDEENNDDGNDDGDDYYTDDQNDKYYAANDDVNGDDAAANGDDGNNNYNNDDYYNGDDGRIRRRELNVLEAAPGQLEAYHEEFWKEVEGMRRSLYDNYYDVGDWNMCEQMYSYGVYCNSDCQALDSFRLDEWSKSDIFLLTLMCVFMAAMMVLIVAKRLRAKQKARMYGDDNVKQGLSPFAMSIIFSIIMIAIVVLASLKFVNETLVFAVVTCILIFIYMLKLTLFERRRPVLLAAPKHDMMWDNPLDDRLFT